MELIKRPWMTTKRKLTTNKIVRAVMLERNQ